MQLVAETRNNESRESTLNKAPRNFCTSLIDSSPSPLLIRLSRFLAGQKVSSYIVGGFVRDMLLGRDTADIDIIVDGDALVIAESVAQAFDGKFIPLDKLNRIARVLVTDREDSSLVKVWELDFCTLTGTLEEDLARRDFTIDAMAIDLWGLESHPTHPAIIDPFNGESDIRERIIRAVTSHVFEDDAIRLLRGIRLCRELGFIIEGNTEGLIKKESQRIRGIAGERIREELSRLIAITEHDNVMPYLDELGLLTAIIPELSEEKEVEQPADHYWDVFNHSLKTIRAVDFLLRRGSWDFSGSSILNTVPWSQELEDHFLAGVGSGSTRRTNLKLAALLHDIAKPKTKSFDDSGRMRFLGHAVEGAIMAREIMERLRFSNREIRLVTTMIEHHLRPTQMSQHGELPTPRAVYRYFRDIGDAGIDIMFLSLADHLATRGPNLTMKGWREHTKIINHLLDQRYEQETVVAPPKLVDGNDLINIFGLEPGPVLGTLLEMIREAQAAGTLNTRDEALSYIRDYLNSDTERK